MRLAEFNAAPGREAEAVVRPCLGVDRWVAEVVEGRPYAGVDDLVAAGEKAASALTAEEVDAALAHHPRIGERARGDSAEAGLSRGEQAGLDTSDSVQARLLEGNRAYEERFGRVFLIRAAGRDAAEILDQLEQRLGNDPATEDAVVADQLTQIAVLRLKGAVTP
ncbi:2-oxo-4-hydroxy-4-carboxy-5-ureidoimidazoline decarboxylase [Pseudonocardia sp. C8]|uniref:2-oxo-4-hydroxy-4-carboxy-5-ureidoimidazoline decarboxylase n=1 Tax=Pseudonocardia sp. C8 TaxID=2762759 RepID=UPI001642ED51|nr:2-oxo-4-hydroxy-4-carboxy-5-ureidoimidazoline decarboxylase [Pseudonocardia sp. C8]MBC3190625.1 2-oxo-4-hydroxy-4-carboxy-5-ureidoimidazoline decarboxylase [Pseudonocardia sp. C8]